MKYRSLSALCLLLFFVVSNAAAAEVKIATGHTFIKRVFDPIRSPFKDKTGIDLSITFFDPVPALVELEKGVVDMAGASLTVENWLELAQKVGVSVKGKSAYTAVVVAREHSRFVVNAENKVKSLSREQLKGIFTGTITNWQEVGGADSPILVVWPSITSGALIIVQQLIMDNVGLTKTLFDVESMGDVPDAVAATPEAIGVITGKAGLKGLREVARPIERPLTLIYSKEPSPAMKKLLEFLSVEGSQYIQ